jgi:hypothetical protein
MNKTGIQAKVPIECDEARLALCLCDERLAVGRDQPLGPLRSRTLGGRLRDELDLGRSKPGESPVEPRQKLLEAACVLVRRRCAGVERVERRLLLRQLMRLHESHAASFDRVRDDQLRTFRLGLEHL